MRLEWHEMQSRGYIENANNKQTAQCAWVGGNKGMED
jgi:hypothetical protein